MGTEDRAIGAEGASLGGRAGRRRGDRIIGASSATQRALEQGRSAARNDLPVCILGPSGSGRELLARAIHTWSSRGDGALEVLSCDSIPEGLQARELFGCAAGVHAQLPAAYEGRLTAAGRGALLLVEPLAPIGGAALCEDFVEQGHQLVHVPKARARPVEALVVHELRMLDRAAEALPLGL